MNPMNSYITFVLDNPTEVDKEQLICPKIWNVM